MLDDPHIIDKHLSSCRSLLNFRCSFAREYSLKNSAGSYELHRRRRLPWVFDGFVDQQHNNPRSYVLNSVRYRGARIVRKLNGHADHGVVCNSELQITLPRMADATEGEVRERALKLGVEHRYVRHV